MMAFSLKKLFGLNAGEMIGKVGEALDKNITNKGEREELRNRLTELLVQHEATAQIELTKRLDVDMNSDSWLSKNIRPMSLVFCTAVITVLTLFNLDQVAGLKLDKSYLDLWESLLIMIYAFYFGSRGVEKIIQSVNKGKETKRERRLRLKEEKNYGNS